MAQPTLSNGSMRLPTKKRSTMTTEENTSAPIEPITPEEAADATQQTATTAAEEVTDTPAEEAPATTAEEDTPTEDVPAQAEDSATTAEEGTPTEDVTAQAEDSASTTEEDTPAEDVTAQEEAAPASVEEDTPEATPEPQAAPAPATLPHFASCADVVAWLNETLANSQADIPSQEANAVKNIFYRLAQQQAEAELKAYTDAGGDPQAWQPAPNTLDEQFKQLMQQLRERRALSQEAQAQQLEANLQRKLAIIQRIKEILQLPDEVNKAYGEVKALQQEWNTIKAVPPQQATELWKSYLATVEQFYDTLKLNNELRAYDFKKNLQLKQAICERAERLAEAEDVVAAFRALQQLHQEFREIGPVERDLREEIWTRFKAASTLINKRHQEHFEQRKQQENQNLQAKTALCEQIEALDYQSLTTFAQWNAMSDQVVELQKQWRTLGYAPRKHNNKIFDRFRSACDAFFAAKSAFFKGVRDSLNENLRQKEALVAQAVELSQSTDWQATTDQMVQLQKQWKQIGAVPKKYSEDVWKRFNAACDAFFAARKEAGFSGNPRSEQQQNLAKKRAIIEQLAAIEPDGNTDLRPILRKAQDDWNEIGHVPYRDKERIYQQLREQMDRLYGAVNDGAVRRRVSRFRSEVSTGDSTVNDRLARQAEILENEIRTYENNLSFLSFSSASASTLKEELNRKVDKLRSDLSEIRLKMKALKDKQQEENGE